MTNETKPIAETQVTDCIATDTLNEIRERAAEGECPGYIANDLGLDDSAIRAACILVPCMDHETANDCIRASA